MARSRTAEPTFTSNAVLTEPGQGAFATLSEGARVLEADPTTDWSRVDLSGQRDHLRDMVRLVTDAAATAEGLPDGLHMTVTSDADTIETVRRMGAGARSGAGEGRALERRRPSKVPSQA